jgi:hypothetical protein
MDKSKVYQYVTTKLAEFEKGRTLREEAWLECWQMYLGTKESREAARAAMFHNVGDVNVNWRHNINTGKGFEIIETIVSYLQQAFFPNRDWFDAIPTSPGYMELAKIVKYYTRNKLIEARFINHWELFLRQLAITGMSVMFFPWEYEVSKKKKNRKVGDSVEEVAVEKIQYDNIKFKVLDVFDTFFDLNASCLEESPIILKRQETRASVADRLRTGYYSGVKLTDIAPGNLDGSYRADEVKSYLGLAVNSSWAETVNVYEYWGDIYIDDKCYKDMVVTWYRGSVLRVEENPYWCGRPFIISTFTPIVRTPVALGALEPILGMLHELDIITNQRLDNLELAADTMFEYVNDGTLQPEDIFTQPGKVFVVAQQGTLRPIETSKNFVVSYDEASVLEQRIDKSIGTGNYIAANSARSGERVTATEVQAVKDAGGNRLSGVHKHIEETALIPLLDKVFKLFQQYQVNDVVIRIPAQEEPDSYDYAAVGVEELENDFKLIPVGADHVADKEYDINQRMAFLQMVSSNPEMSQHIDFYTFMTDIARRMGIEEVDQYIKKQQMGQPQAATMEQTLGKPMADGIKSEIAADGGASLVKDTMGFDTQGLNLAALLQGM